MWVEPLDAGPYDHHHFRLDNEAPAPSSREARVLEGGKGADQIPVRQRCCTLHCSCSFEESSHRVLRASMSGNLPSDAGQEKAGSNGDPGARSGSDQHRD